MLKRRELIGTTVAALGVAAASSLPLASLATEATGRCSITPFSQGLCKQGFEQLLGESIMAFNSHGQVRALRVLSVNDEGSLGPLEQFSVQFETLRLVQPMQPIQDDIYTLVHQQAGKCQLFLTKSGPEVAGRHRYTATFSLLT